MEIVLLGPIEVYGRGHRPVAAGPPQARAVLAALAVDADRPIPVETLIDRVWPDNPPAKVRKAVHVRITKLRGTLLAAEDDDEDGTGTGAGLVWEPAGYRLRLDPDRIDLHRFRRLVAAARAAGCPDAERFRLLGEALALWRGEPLAGMTGDWAEQMRRAWHAERLDAVVAWGRAALAIGRHADAVPLLRETAGRHPLSEPLVAVLGRALSADGRTNEAVDLLAAVSNRLVSELGTGPGAELRDLQESLLTDRVLPASAGSPSARSSSRDVVPAQLPRDIHGFSGRTGHLAHLDARLTAVRGNQPTAAAISVVSGTAGVGKTTLAVHWAHRMARHFPDGQLYVNLRGFDPSGQLVTPEAALRGFLAALGVPAQQVPADLDAQAALYRSLLAGRRVLVVLDNARDAEQVRPLLPGTPTTLTLVTSRNVLTGLIAVDGAHPLALDVLSPVEARELLEHRLGVDVLRREPQAVDAVVVACAHLPLALAVAAARVQQTGYSLSRVAGELADEARRLDALDGGEPAARVEAVFSWSYTALTAPAARLFRLLSLHPGPTVSTAAAASLAGVEPTEVLPLIEELTRASLVAEEAPGRHAMHDLLATYASGLAARVDAPDAREAATGRLLDHYTHAAHTAARVLDPALDPIRVPLDPPAPGAVVEEVSSHGEAMAWLAHEHPAMLAVQALAGRAGRRGQVWQLAWAFDMYLDRQGHWADRDTLWLTTLDDRYRLPDTAPQADAHRLLAHARTRSGRYDEASDHLERALGLYGRAADRVGQARTQHDLAIHWDTRGDVPRALGHSRQALDLFRESGHQRGEALALNGLGWYHAQLGDHDVALTLCGEALALFQGSGDRWGEADTWDSLGYTHAQLGDTQEALGCLRRALQLYRDLGDTYWEAVVHTRTGDIHRDVGDLDSARRSWRAALHIFTTLDHPDADGVRAKLEAVEAGAPAR